jgi:arginine repressor
LLQEENPSSAIAEQRRNKILDYIRQNPKTTKNNVVNYMTANGSSLMTTHKILKDLEIREIIKIEKPNPQMNYLTINDENEFNLISEKLSEIENIISDMTDNLMVVYKAQKNTDTKNLPRNRMDELAARFTNPFLASINTILRILLVRVHHNVIDEEYANSLYTKIVNLMLKVDKYMIYLKPINVLETWIRSMRDLSTDLSTGQDHYLHTFAKNNSIDLSLAKPISDKIQNFKEFFTGDVGFPI